MRSNPNSNPPIPEKRLPKVRGWRFEVGGSIGSNCKLPISGFVFSMFARTKPGRSEPGKVERPDSPLESLRVFAEGHLFR